MTVVMLDTLDLDDPVCQFQMCQFQTQIELPIATRAQLELI
jgi:hypothetical protein